MIEVADEFDYLGTCNIKHCGELADMRRRTGPANNAWQSLPPTMKSRQEHSKPRQSYVEH